MIKLERSNLQAFCRTCLQRLEATSATSSTYGIRETPNLMKLLILCTTLNINEDADDVYPQLLCTKCYQTLQEFQRFRDMALQSNEVLRELVENEDGVLIAPNKNNALQEKYTIEIKSEAPTDEELVDTFKAEETELTTSFYVYDIEEPNVPDASSIKTKNNTIETCDDENTASSDAHNRDAIFEEASTSAHALKRKRTVDGTDSELQAKKRLADTSIYEKISNGLFEKVQGTGPSDVWKYFDRILNTKTQELEPYALCRRCDRIFNFAKGSSPSNLKRHSCYKHKMAEDPPIAVTAINKKVIPNNCKKLIAVNEEIKEEVIQNCMEFVARDLLSCDILNGYGFQALARHLVELGIDIATKNFSISDILPHSTIVRRRLLKLYASEIEVFTTTIRAFIEKGRCAATLEMWSEVSTQRKFLTFTIQFLDNFWHLKTRILFTIGLDCCDDAINQSTENIFVFDDKFEKIKLGRDLHKKIVYTIEQGSDLENILQHHTKINCVTHVLSIILEHTFEKQKLQECAPHIFNLITKCTSLVEYLKQAGKIRVLDKNAKQGSSSQWTTKFDIMFSVGQHFNAIQVLLEMSGESRLDDIDKHLLDDILAILELFKGTIDLFECEKKPTIHLVILHMHILKEKLLALRNAECNKEIRSLLSHCLDNVFEQTFRPHKIHKVAAFLWPQYKQLRYLSFLEREEVYSLVREELHQILTIKHSTVAQSSPSECESMSTIDVDDILRKYKDIHPAENSSENQITIQLELYKCSRFSENNITRWWKMHGKKFPLLAKLARHILCIPATSGGTERCFSSDNRIVEERITTLKDENFDKILFLHSHYKH